MRELARIVDGVLTIDGVAPREVHHVHHVHHHHAPAPAPVQQPVQQERRTAIAPRADTVKAIGETLADIVRAARQMSEQEQRQIYRVFLGSTNLLAAMIQLDHDDDKSAFRRKT